MAVPMATTIDTTELLDCDLGNIADEYAQYNIDAMTIEQFSLKR